MATPDLNLLVEQDIRWVMQDLVHVDGHDMAVIEPKPLPTVTLRISGVMAPGRAAPVMSDGCNKLVSSTLHSTKGGMLDEVINVYP